MKRKARERSVPAGLLPVISVILLAVAVAAVIGLDPRRVWAGTGPLGQAPLPFLESGCGTDRGLQAAGALLRSLLPALGAVAILVPAWPGLRLGAFLRRLLPGRKRETAADAAEAVVPTGAGEAADLPPLPTASTTEERRGSDEGCLAALEATNRTGHALADLHGRVADTARALKRLSEGTGDLTATLESMDAIIDRVAILALNGVIQASRAGADGQGFAIIAEEVERLAEGAARSRQQMALMVQSLRREIGALGGQATGSADLAAEVVRMHLGVRDQVREMVAAVDRPAPAADAEAGVADRSAAAPSA